MPTTDPSPSPATTSSRFAGTLTSLEPEDPLARALNRVKGEGRRRIVAGLAALNVPLSRIPAALLRPSITAAEYAILARKNSWPLSGELLPDLLPGEVEEARLFWLLPDDDRVISLRARPQGTGAMWRAVDEEANTYHLPEPVTRWPVNDTEVALIFDRLRSDSFIYPIGALAACWQAGRVHGLNRDQVRDRIYIRSVTRGHSLAQTIDARFEVFWEGLGETGEAGKGPEAEEVLQ